MNATDTADIACTAPGCRYRRSAKGLCKTHYERQRTGSSLGLAPVVNRKRLTQLQRWCSFVTLPTDPGGCWLWTGAHIPSGYGNFDRAAAHRTGYEMLVGPVAADMHVDHLCRNPGCVNPAHLEPVTCQVNTLRGVGPSARNAAKTECQNGHPFTPESTYRTKSGGRMCRRCKAAWTQTFQARQEVRDRINERVRERRATDPAFRERRAASLRKYRGK